MSAFAVDAAMLSGAEITVAQLSRLVGLPGARRCSPICARRRSSIPVRNSFPARIGADDTPDNTLSCCAKAAGRRVSRAAAVRKTLLDKLATDRQRVIGFHLPFPGSVIVERSGSSYRFTPA
jgi:hypothetical protein